MQEKNNQSTIQILIAIIISLSIVIVFIGIFYILNIQSKIAKLETEQEEQLKRQAETQNMASIQSVQSQPNTKKEAAVDTQGVAKGTTSKSTSQNSGTELQFEKIDSSGMLSLDYVKKRALPVKEIYEEVDFGTFKFKGERLYDARLSIGEQYKELNFYLLPGTYLVCFTPRSYDHDVSVSGKHEREGIDQGYGINVLKYIQNNGLMEMNAKKGSTVYTIEVSKNGGNFHMFMFNDTSKSGALEFSIFKIPGPTLK